MKGKLKNRGFIQAIPFLLPSVIGLLIFSIVPMLTSLTISLTRWNGLDELKIFQDFQGFIHEYFVGFENFSTAIMSPELWRVMRNTGYFIILYVPLIVIVSIAIASLLNTKRKGVGAYRVIYYIPVLTSWVAGALVWKWLLSPVYGPINGFLTGIGLQGPNWLYDEHWAMPAIVLASIWKDAGFFGLIFLGGLSGISRSYYEAAEIDGANRWQQLFRITLPLLSPVIFFVVIICIINSFQLFPQVMIMTDNAGPNGATQVMVERIYKYAFSYFKMAYATTLSWILFAVILVFTVIQLKLQKRWVHYE